MPSSAEPNFDSLGLARQIIDLNVEVDLEVRAGQYERAAALRDQREALQRQLSQFGDATVVQNVQRSLRPGVRAPVLYLLEQDESVVDAGLVHLIRNIPLPPRWILNGYSGSCRARTEKTPNADALDSIYFQAQLPVLSSRTLAKATKPMEWLAAAIEAAAREASPVVWIVEEPAYLAERGILEVVLQVLRVPSTQFVICLQAADAPFANSFTEIPGVTKLTA
jgi:hypothetical protein